MNVLAKQYRYLWLAFAVCMYLVCECAFAVHAKNNDHPSRIIIDEVLVKPMSELSQGQCAALSTTDNNWMAIKFIDIKQERRKNSIKLSLKTPIETATDHNGTGIGDAYVKAKLNETCHNDWHLHSAVNFDYWVTTITYRIFGE